MKVHFFIVVSLLFYTSFVDAQNRGEQFNLADTIRGTYGPSRNWWDVTHYDVNVDVDPKTKTISGFNSITFKVLKKGERIQIDLQQPLVIDSIHISEKNKNGSGLFSLMKIALLDVQHIANAYFMTAPADALPGKFYELKIYYHGKPKEARNPPWDGGFIWSKDQRGNPWITVACQHLGASVWYPCKDHQADEPDSAALTVTIPDSLVVVGNGRLRNRVSSPNGKATYTWAVTSPINNYCLVPYIGDYVKFGENYRGVKGPLSMSYWVLRDDEERAISHFQDAAKMMKAFEFWFGPYPFYKDGYQLVQSPYLGMENQSAIAYGNKFMKGYSGNDLSGTGWGLKWDFIIVHESGHEWFGNNITTKDIADMWVHESFTNYSETLFTEYYYGKKAGEAYVIGTRLKIENDIPIIGTYNVNNEGSGDMYYKGGNMLHTIRQVINDDKKFREILVGLNTIFYHKTVTGAEVEQYISKKTGIDFTPVFDQYLRTTKVPVLEYYYNATQKAYYYRFANCNPGFCMKVKLKSPVVSWINATTSWKKMNVLNKGSRAAFIPNENFYITVKEINP